MQYFVRRELDLNYPINLRRLTPIMKVYAGVISRWQETRYYKTQYNKRMEADAAARVQRDEKLKEYLLAVIYRELDNNNGAGARGEECNCIIVQVKSKFIHSLDRILDKKEFLPYNIERVRENSDFRLAYPDMPILLRVRKKALNSGGDTQ